MKQKLRCIFLAGSRTVVVRGLTGQSLRYDEVFDLVSSHTATVLCPFFFGQKFQMQKVLFKHILQIQDLGKFSEKLPILILHSH